MSTIPYGRRIPATVRTAQILSLLLALPMALGSVVFSVITPDHHHALWVTWLFAPIAFVSAVGLLLTAPRLSRGESGLRRRLLRLLAVVGVFSLVKLTVFGEVESIPFLAVAVVAFACCVCAQRRTPARPRG